jgi:hypothetical protein
LDGRNKKLIKIMTGKYLTVLNNNASTANFTYNKMRYELEMENMVAKFKEPNQ